MHLFTIDHDWDIVQRCSSVDSSGMGAILAACATRDCEIFRYRRAAGNDDANIADPVGYSLLVLSAPAREGMSPPLVDSISDLNNPLPDATTRSPGSHSMTNCSRSPARGPGLVPKSMGRPRGIYPSLHFPSLGQTR